ncbi:MAG TPA: cytochrome c [Conexibacter sp.]|jgi:mono/diheme cytochrome c family protein
MLAWVAFIAFWVVLGLTLFFLALRGDRRRVRSTSEAQGRGGRRAAFVAFGVFYIAFGVAIPLLLGFGNGDSVNARVNDTSVHLTAQEVNGRALFGENCASCHTLAAARSAGPVGPNLDQLKPPASLVYSTVTNGIQGPGGTMPAGLLTGNDARAVAAFVAATAGR